MDSIEVKGREYVKVSIAAERTGYTRDYIGQLCRKKQIDAKLVGRTWYVDLEVLEKKKKDRTRSNFNKTQKAVQAQRDGEGGEPEKRHLGIVVPSYRRRLMEENIRYESDHAESLPALKKEQPPVEEEFVAEVEQSHAIEDVAEVREEDAPLIEETEKIIAVRHVREEYVRTEDGRPTMDIVQHVPAEEETEAEAAPAPVVRPSSTRLAQVRAPERQGVGRLRRAVTQTALLALVFVVSGIATASMSAAWRFTPAQQEGYTQTSIQTSYGFSLKELFDAEMWHPRFLK